MLHLSDVMKLYNEQLYSRDAVMITDEHSNILFMNNVGSNLTNSNNNDYNDITKFMLYDSFEEDKLLLNKNVIVQGVRQLKIFGDKNFWTYLNLIPTDIGNIYLIQCNTIDDAYNNIRINHNAISPIDIDVQLNQLYEDILSNTELIVLKCLLLDFSHNLIMKKINISRTTLNRIFKRISIKIFGEAFCAKQIIQKINFIKND